MTIHYDAELAHNNPFNTSPKYDPTGFWYDCFGKSGQVVWLLFAGDRLLAQVANEQQCENLLRYMTDEQIQK